MAADGCTVDKQKPDVIRKLKSFDGAFPVVVSIERKALDDLFKLSSSTDKQRIKIAMSNLAEISDIVRRRHARRDWIDVTMKRVRVRHIVLEDEDYHWREFGAPSREKPRVNCLRTVL